MGPSRRKPTGPGQRRQREGIDGGGRGGVEQPVFHEGRVVDITDTEVTIKEWAVLTPTG